MKIFKNLKFLLLVVISIGCAGIKNSKTLWEPLPTESAQPTVDLTLPSNFSLYQLDLELLKGALNEVGNNENSSIIMQLPDPNGNTGPFKVWKSSIVSEKLLKKFPSLASYKGFRTSDIGTKIRMETPPSGLQVMVTEPGNTWYISPFRPEEDIYMLYYKSDLKKENKFWEGKN